MKKRIIQSICLILTKITFGSVDPNPTTKEANSPSHSNETFEAANGPDLKKTLGQVESKRYKTKEKIQNHIDGKKFFKQQRLQEKLYHTRNRAHFGNKYELALKITTLSAYMMEKHFSGKRSVIAGASCLKDMQQHINQVSDLKNTYQECLKTYNAIKTKQSVDYFTDDTKTEIIEALNRLFPNQLSLITFLSNAFQPTTTCTAKGYSAMGAWWLGASLSGYRLKCTSQLGRRVLYGALGSSIGIGLGGAIGKKLQHYKKDEANQYTQKTYSLSYPDIRNHKFIPSANTTLSALLGVESNITPTRLYTNMTVGLGYYVGFGITNLFKIKELTPNFKELFEQLDLGFYP